MSRYDYDEYLVRDMVERLRWPLQKVLNHLKIMERNQRFGLSLRSLKRFCASRNISSRSNVSDLELMGTVAKSIDNVGPSYGYRMLKGHLESKNIKHVAEKRIRKCMKEIDPEGTFNRTYDIHRRVNPRRYHCPYFGKNLHCDQVSAELYLYEKVGKNENNVFM